MRIQIKVRFAVLVTSTRTTFIIEIEILGAALTTLTFTSVFIQFEIWISAFLVTFTLASMRIQIETNRAFSDGTFALATRFIE